MGKRNILTPRELLERIALNPGAYRTVSKGLSWGNAAQDNVTLWEVTTSAATIVVSHIVIGTTGTALTVSIFDQNDDPDHRLVKTGVSVGQPIVIPFPMPKPTEGPGRNLGITADASGVGKETWVTVYGWEYGIPELTTTTSTSTSSTSTSSTSTSSTSTSTSSTSTSSTSTSSTSTSTSSTSTSSTSSTSTSSTSTSTSSTSTSTSTSSTSTSSTSTSISTSTT